MGDIKSRKRKHKGFSLVEVLVAAAILSLVVPPILSSFVAIARVNAKSRRKLSATTIANGVMESVKGFELSRVAKECDYQSAGFYVIAGFTGTATEVDYNNPSGGTIGTKSVAVSGTEYTFNGQASGNYAFTFKGVSMDGTTYDVLLKYTKNTTNTNASVSVETTSGGTTTIVTKTTSEILGPLKVRVLTYYDVDIQVFQGGAGFNSKPLAHITGTKADYN